jgi:hypothetical protein
MANIHAALMAVQSELKAPKGQTNKFGGYKFRSCEDILEAVKPLLAKNKLVLRLSDEPVMIGDWHYIKVVATLEADDGSDYSVTAYAREPISKKGSDDSQVTGATSSYARKYALNGLFCIDDTKDADTNEYSAQAKAAEYTCEHCGKEVTATTYNGRNFTPKEIYASTKKRFGKVLCWDCAQSMKKEG